MDKPTCNGRKSKVQSNAIDELSAKLNEFSMTNQFHRIP